ncbi:MAG: vanadium-dependent haloperoxidase [Pseudomonadota bacterium]
MRNTCDQNDKTRLPDTVVKSRRHFVKSAGLATGASVAMTLISPADKAIAQQGGTDRRPRNRNSDSHTEQALRRRIQAAQQQHALNDASFTSNNDESELSGYVGNFTKTLPHNEFGEVDPPAYRSLLRALDSGDAADFETVPAGGNAKLANPRAAFSFSQSGSDSHKIDMPAVHTLGSARQAAEAAEVYWMALCRDVAFDQYASDPLIQAAATDLSAFTDFTAPKEQQQITAATIFRGQTPGDLQGGYISQFLLLDIPYGHSSITQAYHSPVIGDDYMTDTTSWLAIQQGQYSGAFNQLQFDSRPITTGRDLAEYVHQDFTYQAYLNAALICLGFGSDALDQNVYSNASREAGFITFGPSSLLDLVARAARIALRPAWVHKWLVHRKLRPEAMGGRVHYQVSGARNYSIHNELLNSQALARTFDVYGNYLLPQAYPEGSPTHPSYPAGHATIAGACVTILKAYFDENYPIPGANGLTLGGELNKLASNIALGRNMAGVHWRADGDDGLAAGEAIAITLLEDELRMTTESNDAGFSFTRFNGNFESLTVR